MDARRVIGVCLGLLLLTGGGRGAEADPDLAAAEKALQDARQATDGPALVKFFRQRTLSEADRKRLAEVVRALGDEDFAARRRAYRNLQAAGRAARPFLVPAQKSPDPEVARSAERLLREIDSGSEQALTLAAARVLAARKPPGATRTLLAYLPLAGDENLEEAVLETLAAVGVRDGKVNPALAAALKDDNPVRRLAAAYVHGKGGPEPLRALRPLLADPDARVRFHAAAALVRAHDRSAVAALVAALNEAPDHLAWQAEDLLLRIAGEKPPPASLGNSAAERKKCRDAWAEWWKSSEARVDLARVDFKNALRGLTVVCDCDTGKGVGGKLW
jgi:HEAT repeat protein